MGGKGASCWVNDLIRQEGADSAPRRAVGLDQEYSRVSCRKPRDLGKRRRGGGGGCVWTGQWEGLAGLCLELRFSPGNRRPGHQLRRRMRGLRERRYGKVGALMH